MDFGSMASGLGLGEDDFKELADLLVTTSLSDIKKLEKGVASGDQNKVAQAAHSIKGAAGNLGFMDISAIAARTEAQARQGILNEVKDKIQIIKNCLDDISSALKIS